jgi:KUP system potassium uptake protein
MQQVHRYTEKTPLYLLVLGALGVVYGDIGTSPLYALRECFHGEHALIPSYNNVLGVLSLMIWALITIVSIKYLTYVMRADNNGEGGALALMVYALKFLGKEQTRSRQLVIYLGLFGAALIYGDGVITPAISVLSAVEGLQIATPYFQPYIIPVTLLIISALFFVQRGGTAKLGAAFGPVITVWFLVLAALGVRGIYQNPAVLAAFNPLHGFLLFQNNGLMGFYTLGAIFLAVTGAEALYADMGHFGPKPIRIGWFSLVFPSLVINYLGQGALLISDPQATANPFYLLAPSWALYPLVTLATMTTVIASQALISGAFSMTGQAVQLGYLPRIKIFHTSSREAGQIYIPLINWLLFIGTISLVLLFKTSTSLAAAYGIAVSTTMVITTALVFFAARTRWRWNIFSIVLVLGVSLIIDLSFLAANALKFFQGGWLPLSIGIVLFTVMTTWWRGRKILWNHLKEKLIPFDEFKQKLHLEHYVRINGTAVFMIRDTKATPPALIFNLQYNQVLHSKVVFLTFTTEDVPYLSEDEKRVEIRDLGDGFWRVIGRHGFMESVDVQTILKEDCRELFAGTLNDTCFFIDRAIPVPTEIPGMAMWRESLFAFMMQNALDATKFFDVPTERVIEIGFHVEI